MTKPVCGVWVCVLALLSALLLAPATYPQSVVAPQASDSIAIEYAEACLELAKVELARAESLNRRVPNIVPRIRMDGLKRGVQLAQEQVRVAQSFGNIVNNPVQLAFCETVAKDAQQRYTIAEQTRSQDPEAVSALELESLRLKAKTTNLRYRMWKERPYVPSMVEQMQWQINRLTEQIVELNDRLATLESAR